MTLQTRVLYAFPGFALVFSCFAAVSKGGSGCETGGKALANAYVRLNPIYAYFVGDVESYVEGNKHFVEKGDAIRCALALSKAFTDRAIQLYDPDDWRRKQQIDIELGKLGIPSGPAEPTMSSELLAVAAQLSRLARALPSAAEGDYEALNTPQNQIEQAHILVGQLWQQLLQSDPGFAAVLAQHKSLFLEAVNIEYRSIVAAANSLADVERQQLKLPLRNIR